MTFKPFALSPHNHSDKSLDGASTPEQMILRASELGMCAHCVTEHGNMNSAAEFWFASEKLYKSGKTPKKIQIVHGIEAYLQDPINPVRVTKKGKESANYVHLTIHFKNEKAYKHMCSLTPKMEERAVVKFDEKKPILLLEELEPIAKDITLCSSCLVGGVMKYVLNNDYDSAKLMYERLRSFAGPENWAVEVFPHDVTRDWVRPKYDKTTKQKIAEGYFKINECDPLSGLPFDKQKAPSQFVIEMAKKYGDKILTSLDAHFSYPRDKLIQDMKLGNGTERFQFYNSYHMMDTQEAYRAFKEQLDISERDMEEWIENSYAYLENFKDYTFKTAKDRVLMPTMDMIYEVRPEETTKTKLADLIKQYGRMPTETNPQYLTYKTRLDEEISVLADNGVTDWLPYLFLIEDCFGWARKNNYTCSARGSAVGSLIVYLLGISMADPIRYDLSFQRFLTLGRLKSGSMPDLDADIFDRDTFLDYLQSKYGDKFATISTNLLLRLKSTIKDYERAKHGEVPEYIEKMCVRIPQIPQGINDREWLFGYTDTETGEFVRGFIDLTNNEGSEMLRQYRNNDEARWQDILECIGIARGKGVHAGGVVIANESIIENMPIFENNERRVIGFDMKGVEAVGGIKYDFLGLKTLDSIGRSIASVNARKGNILTWDEPPYDPKVFEDVVCGNKLTAIFQINTSTMLPFVNKLQPKSVEEISNLIALVRPGALDADSPKPGTKYKNAAEYYAACVRGEEQPYYIHPDLEPILSGTYGVCLFQEQLIKIAKLILDLDDSAGDEFRRATGKKDKQLSELNARRIREGCISKGWTPEQGAQMADLFMAASRYSFNCISGESLVKTKNGLISLKQIVEEFGKHEVAYLNRKFEVAYEIPSRGESKGLQSVLKIGKYGFSTTPDHKFLTTDASKSYYWEEAGEICDKGLWAYNVDSCYSLPRFDADDGEFQEEVFDIEMPTNHNFILECGAVAHNCSHSISYALIAYYGAYLKFHHPADFWLGELTVHAGDQSRVREYLKECRHLVLPIDIIKSHATEWKIEEVNGKEMLRPPLVTVKGCGDVTVSHLKSFVDGNLGNYENKPIKEKAVRQKQAPKEKKGKQVTG